MNVIELNFRKARQQADSLDELASRLEGLTEKEFRDVMQNLSWHWKGENAAAYLQKGSRVEEELVKTAKDIRQTASSIRTAAKKLYDAEMYAQRQAAQRAYKGGGGSSGGGGSERSW